jgi:hypothetical protein
MSRRITLLLTAIVLGAALDACQSPTAPAPPNQLTLRRDGTDTTARDTTRRDSTRITYPTQPWY